ncbi:MULTISPECIES: hypothetical protein [unclassified Streptomyces]|uniref:hypothetical protein n=1 Tax=unclassified Streptomyces TaxID=2593676 RepID=UPI0035E340A0
MQRGINPAACRACVLPKTGCEHNNGPLDRILLIATLEDPAIGIFSDALLL